MVRESTNFMKIKKWRQPGSKSHPIPSHPNPSNYIENIPFHPIPGEVPAGRGMKLCLVGYQQQDSQAQLHAPLEELPWVG